MFAKFLKTAIAATLMVLPHVARPSDLVISTGGPTGTYYAIGQQISELMKQYGIDIEVAESQGSVQNLKRLLGYEGIGDSDGGGNRFFQLALVQGDVLLEMRNHARGNQALEEIVDQIKVVLPLYGEEIHVMTTEGSDFADIEDVLARSQTIASGAPGSGTRQTVQSLLRMLGMETRENALTPSGGEEALVAVSNYVAEAAVMVGGAPMSILSEKVTPDSGLHLLPATLPELYDIPDSPYRAAMIRPDMYPWLDGPVRTTAVVAFLVAYNYDANNKNCGLIEKTTKAIVDNIGRLQATGHPKWKEFDLRAARQRTDLYDCAKRALVLD